MYRWGISLDQLEASSWTFSIDINVSDIKLFAWSCQILVLMLLWADFYQLNDNTETDICLQLDAQMEKISRRTENLKEWQIANC